MARYTKDVKAKAVAMAKEGVALKTIQLQLGPNPKAVMRYLLKEDIVYAELKKELLEKGTLAPHWKVQGKKKL